MLRCYVEDHPSELPRYVRALCYAYNTSVHQMTRKVKFEFLLTRAPPEFSIKHKPGRNARDPSREEYVEGLKIALGMARESLS